MMRRFKVVLIGEGGVGKTTLITKLLNNTFERKYIATLGVDVHPIVFNISDGTSIVLDIWDCAGQDKFGGLRDGYYINAKACIVAYDRINEFTPTLVNKWIHAFRYVCNTGSIVLCKLKADIDVSMEEISNTSITCSTKSGYNIFELFSKVIKSLVGDEIEIVSINGITAF